MSAGEFGRLGPGELAALFDEWQTKEMREDLRAGVIVTMLANVNRDSRKCRPFHPADFFPSLEKLRPPPSDPEEVWEKIVGALGVPEE